MGKTRKSYPTDVTDAEWEFLLPYLTLMRTNSPQRVHDLREVFNGMRCGIKAVIPHRDNEKARHDPKVKFDKETYKRRCIIEQAIGWLKECRRVATRYEKLLVRYVSMIQLALIRQALNCLF